MAVVDLVLFAGAILLLVSSLTVLVEIVAGVVGGGRIRAKSQSAPRVGVLVPAHDEEAVIAGTLRSIQAQLRPEDRLLVVADNCTDATADIASSLGAEVVTRTDPIRRAKGYAVGWGIRQFAADPPDVLVVIDADCELSSDCIARISGAAVDENCLVQAHYEMLSAAGTKSPGPLLSAFAFKVKNTLRPRGLNRLGLPCQLMGTGMAFPWTLVVETDLSSGDLAEDLVWGLMFAQKGHAPRFCEAARVTSVLPASSEGQSTQRSRWEKGHLSTIRSHVPRLLIDGVRRGNVPLLALVLDASVPPLALHGLCVIALTLVAALSFLLGGAMGPLVLMGIALSSLVVSLVLAWTSVGRDDLNLTDLVAVPAYALSKIPLYAQMFVGKHSSWTRTKRD